MSPTSPPSYASLLALLLPPTLSAPLLPPPSPQSTQLPTPHDPTLAGSIAHLQLHPTLEALLHILNRDLAAAHFLVRHMQAEPKWEGMLLHALLHRVEGDTENARAWYRNVQGSEVFEGVWGALVEECGEVRGRSEGKGEDGQEDAHASSTMLAASAFLDRIAALRSHRSKRHTTPEWQEECRALELISEREVRAILGWCEREFGTGAWQDASSAFVGMAEKHKEIASKMLVGGEGWRNF